MPVLLVQGEEVSEQCVSRGVVKRNIAQEVPHAVAALLLVGALAAFIGGEILPFNGEPPVCLVARQPQLTGPCGGGVVRGAGVVNEGVVKVEQDCANIRWMGCCCHDHGAYPAEYMLSPAPQLSTPRGTASLYTIRQGHRLTNGVPGIRARCP